ncbi:MAG: hypothetical protein KAK00_04585 [Nanoarchaeota archaeon]|nr:hypothetical protein [Thermodesulfovibrionia bacterium]MCK5282660.1 hypothetical protein [Nanoarchaeota archaeon]
MNYIKICPKCGSTDTKIPNAGLDMKMILADKCLNCDFIGNFPEVESDKIEEFKDKIKKQ